MIPHQLDSLTFESYYVDCLLDGLDSWDAIWYVVNYLPPRFTN